MTTTIVEPPAPTIGARYFAWLYAVPDARAAVAAVFAIEREIDSSTDATLDHSVSHARLAWWREECARLSHDVPRHPATIEVHRRSQSMGREPPDLSGLVDNAHWDLACAAPLQPADLTKLAARWATTVFAATATLAAPALISDLGAYTLRAGSAVWELNQLATFREQAALGRLRVAMPDLEAHGLTAADVLRTPLAAPLLTALHTRLDAARAELHHSIVDLDPADQPHVRGTLAWANVALRIAHRMSTPTQVTLLDSWSAWRMARLAATGRARIL